MNTQGPPIVRALKGDESQRFLTRNRVGRIAYAEHDRVDVEPIHFVYDAPWIFGRTSAGAKLLTLSHNSWCAFEVDEVLGMFDWISVVVKGRFSVQHSAEATWSYDVALGALRRLLPSTLTPDDPSPNRDVVFAVHAAEISGRCSVSNGAATPKPVLTLIA